MKTSISCYGKIQQQLGLEGKYVETKGWRTNMSYLLAQASLKQRFDKARCMKITCVWWRSTWRLCF